MIQVIRNPGAQFKRRKGAVKVLLLASIEQFAAMKETERRLLVRSLSDEEYLDILAVCSTFPHVNITAETQGGQG